MTTLKLKSGKPYVYAHKYKKKIIYVGKGIGGRAYSDKNRNKRWQDFVRINGDIDVEILKWFEDEKLAEKYEKRLIKELSPTCNILHTEDCYERSRRTTPRKEAKTKVFSVSFNKSELKEIEDFIDELSSDTGASISRNALIRKASVMHVRYMKQGADKKFKDLFKQVK